MSLEGPPADDQTVLKFIHITDPHLVRRGERVHGLDPGARLEHCIGEINDRHEDAVFCVITGDLVNNGDDDGYSELGRLLEQLRVPTRLLLGNHDHREGFARALADAPRDSQGFVQSALTYPGYRFLFLDTHDEGSKAGRYCARRLDWLNEQLATAADRDVFLFMHHPPFRVGIPNLDRIGLVDVDDFVSTIGRYHNLRHIFFGHAHRPISGHWRKISFSTLFATNHQLALDLTLVEQPRYTHEGPVYGIVLVDAERIVIHSQHLFGDSALGQQ